MFSTFLTPLIAEELDRSALRTVSSSEIVYRYDLQHPGQIYFPFHQVSVYFAEHKFYHSDWGVMDLIAGRFPVSKTEVWSHIPPAARFIAYPPDVRTDIQTPYLAPSHRRVDLPGLPGFAVFELER
jgi:hypothetical protein